MTRRLSLDQAQPPNLRDFVRGCSYINLCRLTYIEVTSKCLYDLWGNVLEHRHADKSLEGYLGQELASLTDVAHKVMIPQPEVDRLHASYIRSPGRVYANLCQFYKEGKCLKNDMCSYIHAELEGEYGRNPCPPGRG